MNMIVRIEGMTGLKTGNPGRIESRGKRNNYLYTCTHRPPTSQPQKVALFLLLKTPSAEVLERLLSGLYNRFILSTRLKSVDSDAII